LINEPYLPIFKHIEKHDAITDSEISNILGNSRISRQFAGRFGEYLKYLPFSIKVETLGSSNRYVKENIQIVAPSTSNDISSLIIREPELDFSETEQVTLAYDTCRFCEKSPIPGQDICYSCN
jgi:hypothetical protein